MRTLISYQQRKNAIIMIKQYILKKKPITILYFILIILAPIVEVTITYTYYAVFDAIGSEKQHLVLELIVKAATLFVLDGLIKYWISVVRQIIVSRARIQIKNDCIKKLFENNYSDFSKENVGTYISDFTNDISLLEYKYIQGVLMLCEALLSIVTTGIAIFSMGLKKTMVAVIIIGEIVSVSVCFIAKRYSVRVNNRFFDGLASFTETLKDLFSCFFLFRNYGVENRIFDNFKEKNSRVETVKTDADITTNFVFSISKLCTSFLKFVVVGLGVVFLAVFNGTFAEIYLSYQFTGQIFSPTQNIIARINDINSVNGLVKKYKKLLFSKLDDYTTVDYKCSSIEINGIRFKNVSLLKSEKVILNQVNLNFEPNKKYLIIGRNGSGKSSLLRLLKGFDTEYTGEILINGKEMKCYNSKELADRVIYINEQVSLFCDSVKNNITMYNSYPEEDILNATQMTGLKVDLDRIVSDGEINLSSGERRRIELARAYLSKAPVLVFDEAISTLDIQTAYSIEKTMLDMPDRTIVFVSHNFSSSLIRKYDAIILISDGEIVGQGTHDELMNSSELYRHIINIKSGVSC